MRQMPTPTRTDDADDFDDEDDEYEDDDDEGEEDEDDERTRTRPRPLAPLGRQCRREVAQEVEALVDLFDRRVRAGHQEARPAGQGDLGQVTPRSGSARPAQIVAARL